MNLSTVDKNQIHQLVEQLYESEGLTDALTDEAATLLLNWGEQQLNNLAHLRLSQADLENAAHALQRAIRSINHLIERRADLSDAEMVEHLLKLMDQVIIVTAMAQQAITQEGDDGQKAEEYS